MCKGRRDLPPRSHLRVAGLPPPGIRNWDAAADARIVKAIVQKIMQLISTDTDGKRILDYLGPVLKELMKSGDVKIMVQPACDFVVAEQERFLLWPMRSLGSDTLSCADISNRACPNLGWRAAALPQRPAPFLLQVSPP